MIRLATEKQSIAKLRGAKEKHCKAERRKGKAWQRSAEEKYSWDQQRNGAGSKRLDRNCQGIAEGVIFDERTGLENGGNHLFTYYKQNDI